MHCTNCGAYVLQGARFCAGCGAPAVDPEMTRLAGAAGGAGGARPFAPPPAPPQPVMRNAPAHLDRAHEDERQVFKTRPTLFFIKLGYGLAALGAILLIILLAYYVEAPWFIALPVALALLLVPAYYHIKRNTVQYTLTSHKIEIDEGFIARTTRNLPLRNIQDVTVSATVPQRLLGYGNIVIDNASELGGSTVLRNIHNPRQYADLLLRELRRYQ